MEKENKLNAQVKDLSFPKIKKKEFPTADFEEFVNKLPSDNPRISLFKRMFAFHVRVNKYQKEKRNS